MDIHKLIESRIIKNEKFSKGEIITGAVVGVLGVGVSAYSLILRNMAERGLINYSYMQGVGIHYGLGIGEGLFFYGVTKSPKLAFAMASASLSLLELLQIGQSTLTTRFTLEDIVGSIIGAAVGSFAPKYVPKAINYCKTKYANYKNSHSLETKINPE